jgi:hypothetical protein
MFDNQLLKHIFLNDSCNFPDLIGKFPGCENAINTLEKKGLITILPTDKNVQSLLPVRLTEKGKAKAEEILTPWYLRLFRHPAFIGALSGAISGALAGWLSK